MKSSFRIFLSAALLILTSAAGFALDSGGGDETVGTIPARVTITKACPQLVSGADTITVTRGTTTLVLHGGATAAGDSEEAQSGDSIVVSWTSGGMNVTVCCPKKDGESSGNHVKRAKDMVQKAREAFPPNGPATG